jgi:hypothetical protein
MADVRTRYLVVRFGGLDAACETYRTSEEAARFATVRRFVDGVRVADVRDPDAMIAEVDVADLPNAEDTPERRYHWLVHMSQQFALRAVELLEKLPDKSVHAEQLFAHHETAMQWHSTCALKLERFVTRGTMDGPTKQEVRAVVNEIAAKLKLKLGCMDSGCVFGASGGMQTNGGCRCYSVLADEATMSNDMTHLTIRRSAMAIRELATEVADRRRKGR